MADAKPDSITDEIQTRFRLAGVVLSTDRAAGAVSEAKAGLETLHFLRGPRSAAAEPSNIFTLVKEATK
jgi:hypothetical protein